MDSRRLAPFLVVTVGTAAIIYSAANAQQSDGPLVHQGRVLDLLTGTPVGASVKAWPNSERTGTDGDCVLYGDAPLDSKLSESASGGFELAIEPDRRTYTVTYCASGYHTRTDRDLPNTAGTPVLPTPARLWPVAMATADSAVFQEAVRARAVIVLNDLAYLRSLNPEQFDVTLAAYSNVLSDIDKERADAVSGLQGLTAAWGE